MVLKHMFFAKVFKAIKVFVFVFIFHFQYVLHSFLK